MSAKSERQAARETVAEYHQAQLALLIERVAVEMDRYCAGELDVYDLDQVLFQYSRGAKELWTFCNLGDVEATAHFILERPLADWWDRGAPRKR